MKKQHSISVLIVIVMGSLLIACSPSRNAQQADFIEKAYWQKDSLLADGNDGDWSAATLLPDEKLGIQYAVSNDHENLYVQLSSQNEAVIQRILRGGLTLLINRHGVKDDAGAAGIVFPTGNRVEKDGKLLNDRPELQQNKHVALNAVQDYSLFGFRELKTPENFDYGKPNPEGIELGIGLNTAGAVVYEAAIPLSSFFTDAERISPARKTVAIGFILDYAPGQGEQRRGGGGGLSIGGGLGFGSFGTGGGLGISIGSGSLGRIGGGNRQGKPTRTWHEFQLAKQPVVK